MEWKIAFMILTGLFLLFIIVTFMLKPFKVLYRLAACTFVGTVLILLANVALGQMGVYIPLNPATVLTVGILKIPGAILLVVLNYFYA
ncbi:MAG: pro-sigmaK processing inhibitor BofA family protein [Bacillota bacterium]